MSNRPADEAGTFDADFPRTSRRWERAVLAELESLTGTPGRWPEGSCWDAAEDEDEAVRSVELAAR